MKEDYPIVCSEMIGERVSLWFTMEGKGRIAKVQKNGEIKSSHLELIIGRGESETMLPKFIFKGNKMLIED